MIATEIVAGTNNSDTEAALEISSTFFEIKRNGLNLASGYALEALHWAVENDIINGKGGGVYVAATGRFNMNGGVISSIQLNQSTVSDRHSPFCNSQFAFVFLPQRKTL